MSSSPYLSRLKALQLIVERSKVDGLLLVAGIDGNFDKETAQVLAFLLEGKSGHQLLETSMVEQTYEDIIFLVTPTSFKCYCQSRARDQIVKRLAGGLEGCQIFKPTEEEESDVDVLEEYKIGSFVQIVKGLGAIGLPSKGPLDIESWPLIQSYGIEGIGKSGFFSMNFKVTSLFDEIRALYPQIDGQGFVSLLQHSLPMFLKHSNEVFALIDRESLHDLRRMEECEIIEPFMDYFSCREIRNSTGEGEENNKDKTSMFRPRILAGQHTNEFQREEKSQSLPFGGGGGDSNNESVGHFIIELADPKMPLACTRTCFLSSAALREGGLYPSDEDLFAVDDFQEMKAQWCPVKQDILYLYHCYISLIDAGHAAMEFFSINPRSTKHSDVEEIAKETFSHGLISRGLRPLPLSLHIEEIDLAGTVFPAQAGSNRLKRLRVSCGGLQSQMEGGTGDLQLLGSVAYGETFIDCPRSTKGFEILSSGIPLVQSWPVLQVENIIQKYMSKLLRKISDESLVSSDRSRNEMTSTLGELVIDGAEQVTILTSNKYMPSIRGEMYIFERGFVFYSPKVLPIVVEFEKDLESFTRYVPDQDNVMSTAVLLFELRNTSLTGFSGAEEDHELVGLALNTLEPSACRYFNHKVWPSWMETLSSLKSGGMKVVYESLYPRELWELHAYSSCERSKGYPLVLSDEKCTETASYFNGDDIVGKPKARSTAVVTTQEKDGSIPLVLVVGIPGSGHESLVSLLLESAADRTTEAWRVVKKPLAGIIDNREDLLSKRLEETMSNLKMEGLDSERSKPGLLLPLVGYKDLRSNLKSLLNTKQVRSGSLYVHRIIGCLHTDNLVVDGRSMYYGGVFEQLLEEYVSNVVIFGDSKASAYSDIKSILKSRLPNAKLIHASNVAGSSLLGGQQKTDAGQKLSFSRMSTQPEAMQQQQQQIVYVTSTCSIKDKEKELVSILQGEINKSEECLRAMPSLEDGAPVATSLVWLKVVYICPSSKSRKELSVVGRDVKIAKSDSEQICLPSEKQQVQWIFVGENLSERYLTNLIKRCVQSPQQTLKLREPADLRATEKQKIQKEHVFDPLPEGYQFTGFNYVDMDGNISNFHPHFNQYANHYLEKENQDVLKKNEAIQSYNSDLVDLQVKQIIRL